MNNVFLTAQIERIEVSEIETDSGIVTRYYYQLYRDQDEDNRTGALVFRATWTPRKPDRERAAILEVGDYITLSGRLAPDIHGKLIIRAWTIDKIANM